MVKNWKVILHEATSRSDVQRGEKAAKEAERFSVQGDGPDGAKISARRWLEGKGFTPQMIRAINVSAAKDQPFTLIAYVASGAVAAAKLKTQADQAKRKGLSK